MNNEDMMTEMFVMQSSFNRSVDYMWKHREYDWLLAAADECIELCGHLGYKWWKEKPETTIFQQRLEIVDVFCFCLSHELKNDSDRIYSIPGFIARSQNDYKLEKIKASKQFAHRCLAGIFDLTEFGRLCRAFDLSFFALYRMFMAKAALNNHRQKNGYKMGEYKKIWSGSEDNVHLENIFYQLGEVEDGDLFGAICERLQQEYERLCGE